MANKFRKRKFNSKPIRRLTEVRRLGLECVTRLEARDRRLWRIPASVGFIIARGSVYKPLRLVKGRMDRRLGNRRRFFRATGFEIGNATGRAQRKLAKKESRPQSRSLPILPSLRDPPLLEFRWEYPSVSCLITKYRPKYALCTYITNRKTFNPV